MINAQVTLKTVIIIVGDLVIGGKTPSQNDVFRNSKGRMTSNFENAKLTSNISSNDDDSWQLSY